MVAGFPAVCVFVNDTLECYGAGNIGGAWHAPDRTALCWLQQCRYSGGISLGLHVVRVPAYSPHSVAEHTVGLILSLNRRLHQAYNRVRNGNFALQGLLGFELRGKTVGIIGTGRIGTVVAEILRGFGCRVIAFDPTKL